MPNTTWILEQTLAKNLGVGRAAVAEYRKNYLEKNRDWRLEKKQVELSGSAAQQISAALGASLPGDAGPDRPLQASADNTTQVPGPVELVVSKVYPNPRLLGALTADGELVRVAVSRNQNFRPGMKIQARPPMPPPAAQLYRLEGRPPRRPGRY